MTRKATLATALTMARPHLAPFRARLVMPSPLQIFVGSFLVLRASLPSHLLPALPPEVRAADNARLPEATILWLVPALGLSLTIFLPFFFLLLCSSFPPVLHAI